MTGLFDPRQAHAQFVDAIFARTAVPREAPDLAATPPPAGKLDPSRFAQQDPAAPALPPPLNGDPQSEYEWLVEERKRLEVYTHRQMGLVKQQREEFLRYCTQMEEALALKGQELNRQQKQANLQADSLQKREQEAARREAFLATHEEQCVAAEKRLLGLQGEITALQTESAWSNQRLQELRKVVADLEEVAARQAHLDDRYRALELGEAALQQRLQEVEDLETQLRQELEAREREIELEYQQAEVLREQLLQRWLASESIANSEKSVQS